MVPFTPKASKVVVPVRGRGAGKKKKCVKANGLLTRNTSTAQCSKGDNSVKQLTGA